ncbi:cell division protein FtsQ/DivIB [Sporosarcina oncorhynchi]|uniref:Cell division protein DivIB n=1 Tax=Sporosarcina oncorhynchi TaxID=3056444 RepID=A0ABZ0L4K1_9BACL|nr:cell division protein FtsQ/DivIB [Sporosarcina sp. T2O-4]WOV86194.1 cell division protein FtsQ/DivIB [Sporosarcina sp. T2O-4]
MDKVIDIEERIPSLREKRRRKTNKKFLFIIAIFFIALLVLLYFQSPYSKVGEIVTNGAHLYEDTYYIEKSGISSGTPYWSFSTEGVQKQLASIDGVKEVTVTRKLLRDIDIAIIEWETVAYIEDKGNYSLLLENGEIFRSENISSNIPILNHVDDSDVRKKLTAQLLKIDDEVLHLISEIIYTGSGDDHDTITVYMDDGYEVRAIIQTFAESMVYYPEITSQLNGLEKGIIDMEVGTFFSPFSEVYGGGEGEEGVGDEVDEESE